MNKADTAEAIKEAQILLSLEIFFVKGQKAQAQDDLDKLKLVS